MKRRASSTNLRPAAIARDTFNKIHEIGKYAGHVFMRAVRTAATFVKHHAMGDHLRIVSIAVFFGCEAFVTAGSAGTLFEASVMLMTFWQFKRWRRGTRAKKPEEARVRSVGPAGVRALIERAERARYEYRGSRSWLDGNETVITHAFVISLREPAEQPGAKACALLLLNERNYCGWMRISLAIEDFSALAECTQDEQQLIALNLAMRGPLLKSEQDILTP